eukprot:6486379-Amphidinium_carterae.3
MECHGQLNSTVQQALQAAEADKCRQDRRSNFKFIPLVHHYTGMLGLAASDLANLILRDLATKSATADGVQWQAAIGRTREQIFQEVTTTHMRSQYRVCRVCVPRL